MRIPARWRAAVLAAPAILALAAIDRIADVEAQPATEARQSGAETRISDADNGTVVSVLRGAVVVVTLGSTYWMIADSSDAVVLEPRGDVRYAPDLARCAPGMGCGSVSRTFFARTPGRAELSATRNACGEALACRPDQNSFRVTVVVQR